MDIEPLVSFCYEVFQSVNDGTRRLIFGRGTELKIQNSKILHSLKENITETTSDTCIINNLQKAIK